MFETYASGTLIADGTEQIVSEISEPTKFSGYISLAQMQAGDTVIIRQYAMMFAVYELYATETYVGAQPEPLVYVTPKEITSSLRVTLEQVAGVLRTFDYKFMKEVELVSAGAIRV
jgi:predicted butyrate kinase (DUF1464 family)